MCKNITVNAAINDALRSAKSTHSEWHSAFEDSRIATQAPIEINELIKWAPTDFLAGVVAGAVYWCAE